MINQISSRSVSDYDIEANVSWKLKAGSFEKKIMVFGLALIGGGITGITVGYSLNIIPLFGSGIGITFVGLAFPATAITMLIEKCRMARKIDEKSKKIKMALQRKNVNLSENKENQIASISTIPDVTWRLIIHQISRKDVLNMALVCKKFCRIISDSSTWGKIIESENLSANELWNKFVTANKSVEDASPTRQAYSKYKESIFHFEGLKEFKKKFEEI